MATQIFSLNQSPNRLRGAEGKVNILVMQVRKYPNAALQLDAGKERGVCVWTDSDWAGDTGSGGSGSENRIEFGW